MVSIFLKICLFDNILLSACAQLKYFLELSIEFSLGYENLAYFAP